VRVQFKTEGGIAYLPGLSRPVTIDSDQLSPEEAAELKQLIEATDFFDLPANVGPSPRGAADYRQHTVTIEQGGRQHTVQLNDLVQDTHLQRLLTFLRTKASEVRKAGRTGFFRLAHPSPGAHARPVG
jgi:hypothetical protein